MDPKSTMDPKSSIVTLPVALFAIPYKSNNSKNEKMNLESIIDAAIATVNDDVDKDNSSKPDQEQEHAQKNVLDHDHGHKQGDHEHDNQDQKH